MKQEKKQERGNYGANSTLRTRFRKINRLGDPARRLWVLGDCAAVRDFLGVVLVIAWLIVFSGGFQFIHAFQSKGIGSIVWKLLVGVLYLIAGLYFVINPLLGVAAFTFALAIFFVAEGLVDLVAYFQNRSTTGSGWILFDGIVTLILGLMVWRQWPSSSLWVIGTLVGISMILTGTTRLMLSVASRGLQHSTAG